MWLKRKKYVVIVDGKGREYKAYCPFGALKQFVEEKEKSGDSGGHDIHKIRILEAV